MTDDPQQIRDAARAVDGMARRARTAQRSVTSSQGVTWSGASAERFRRRARERAGELGACARELDELRDRLRAHAREVERRERSVADLARRGRAGLEELRDDVADHLRHHPRLVQP